MACKLIPMMACWRARSGPPPAPLPAASPRHFVETCCYRSVLRRLAWAGGLLGDAALLQRYDVSRVLADATLLASVCLAMQLAVLFTPSLGLGLAFLPVIVTRLFHLWVDASGALCGWGEGVLHPLPAPLLILRVCRWLDGCAAGLCVCFAGAMALLRLLAPPPTSPHTPWLTYSVCGAPLWVGTAVQAAGVGAAAAGVAAWRAAPPGVSHRWSLVVDPLGDGRYPRLSLPRLFLLRFGPRMWVLASNAVCLPIALALDGVPGASWAAAFWWVTALLAATAMAAAVLVVGCAVDAALPPPPGAAPPGPPMVQRAYEDARRSLACLVSCCVAVVLGAAWVTADAAAVALVPLDAVDGRGGRGGGAPPSRQVRLDAAATQSILVPLLCTSLSLLLAACAVCGMMLPRWRLLSAQRFGTATPTSYAATHGLGAGLGTDEAAPAAQAGGTGHNHNPTARRRRGGRSATGMGDLPVPPPLPLPTWLVRVGRARYRRLAPGEDPVQMTAAAAAAAAAGRKARQLSAGRSRPPHAASGNAVARLCSPPPPRRRAASASLRRASSAPVGVEERPLPVPHAGGGGHRVSVGLTTPAPSRGEDEPPACAVCCAERADGVLLDCGHGGLCVGCSLRVSTAPSIALRRCPWCREGVRGVVQLLLPGDGGGGAGDAVVGGGDEAPQLFACRPCVVRAADAGAPLQPPLAGAGVFTLQHTPLPSHAFVGAVAVEVGRALAPGDSRDAAGA